MDNLKSKSIRGGVARLFGQGASFVLRLGFMVIMARLLDPSDFGLVAMVTAVTGIYELFTTAGLSLASVQKSEISHGQISALFWINLAVGGILGLLCLVTAPLLAAFYGEPRLIGVTLVLGLGFFLNAAGVQHSALMQRQLRYVELTAMDLGAQILGCAVAIVLALNGLGYWSLAIGAVTTPATMTASLWLVSRWTPGRPRRDASIRPMLNFGATITMNGLLVYFAYNIDKVLIGRYWGADILGLYSRVYQLINIPASNVNTAAGSVVFPSLSRLQADTRKLSSYFLKAYTLSISLSIPAIVFGAVFAEDVVRIVLGEKWTGAATMFRLLAPAAMVQAIINPLSWLLLSVSLHRRSLWVSLVIAPLVITSVLIGLPYGASGIAAAYSATMVIWFIPHVLWCLRGTMVKPIEFFITTSRPLLAGLFAVLFAYIVQTQLQIPSVFERILISAFVTGSVYLATLLIVFRQSPIFVDVIKGLKAGA